MKWRWVWVPVVPGLLCYTMESKAKGEKDEKLLIKLRVVLLLKSTTEGGLSN